MSGKRRPGRLWGAFAQPTYALGLVFLLIGAFSDTLSVRVTGLTFMATGLFMFICSLQERVSALEAASLKREPRPIYVRDPFSDAEDER